MDIQLELKDRINYPHILQTTILNIKKAIGDTEIDITKLENMIWDLFTDIPHSWYDEEFSKDVKNSFISKTIDNRPSWGGVKLSTRLCKEKGIPLTKSIVAVNIYLLKNAIVNLLHRRDMLVRKKKIEHSTGNNLAQTLDDLEPDEEDKDENDENDEMIISVSDERIQEELEEIEKKDKDEGVGDD